MKRLYSLSGVWLVLAIFCAMRLPARANILIVGRNDDGPVGSLRERIQAAAPDDTIIFDEGFTGTITLTNVAGALLITNNLTIIGPGASSLSISGNNSNRVFNILTNTIVTIAGLTIRDGHDHGTNGIYSWGCDPNGEIVQTPPSPGGSAMGGGILNSGMLTLSNCVLSSNVASGGRGGRGIVYAICSQNQGNLYSNGANGGDARGGAIFNWGQLSLIECMFTNNAVIGGTGGDAGLRYFAGDGGFAAGGAAYSSSGLMTVLNCCFAANSITAGSGGGGGDGFSTVQPGVRGGFGGGAWGGALVTPKNLEVLTPCAITNCTFYGNSATAGNGGQGGSYGGRGGSGGPARGGAVVALDTCVIRSCTISSNSVAGGSGGAGGSPGGANGSSSDQVYGGGTYGGEVQNTIIAANMSGNWDPDVSGASSSGFNLIGITNYGGWMSTDLTGSSAAPLNPQLGPLHDNGGPTPTMLPLTNSPAIDKGNSYGLTTDQRGFTRPVNLADVTYPNAAGGDGSDIGAVEIQAAGLDIGLRLFDGTASITIACEFPAVSPLRIAKGGTIYGIVLVPTSSPDASKFRVQTASGTKSLMKLP